MMPSSWANPQHPLSSPTGCGSFILSSMGLHGGHPLAWQSPLGDFLGCCCCCCPEEQSPPCLLLEGQSQAQRLG